MKNNFFVPIFLSSLRPGFAAGFDVRSVRGGAKVGYRLGPDFEVVIEHTSPYDQTTLFICGARAGWHSDGLLVERAAA